MCFCIQKVCFENKRCVVWRILCVMLDDDGFERCECLVLERFDVDLFFLAFYLPKLWTCAGMAGGEYRTAILVGKNGRFKGVDLAGDADDLFFIHADAGTEYGTGNDAIGNAERLHGLACDLTEAFACDERVARELFGGAFGKTHHEAAEQEREVIFLTGVAQDLLYLGDGNDVNVDIARIRGELFRKREALFACAFAGIGEALKVHRIQTDTALGDHKACDGAIDTARKQEKTLAVGADGHTADGAFLSRADVCGIVADLHANGNVGMMHVDALMTARCFQNGSADLGGDFGRFEREFFIGALCLDLEGLGVFNIGHELRFDRFENGAHILFGFDGAADSGDAEGIFGGDIRAFHVGVFLERFDVYGALHGIDLEFAERLGAALQNIAEKLFKMIAVGTLERDFAVFAENDFFHES